MNNSALFDNAALAEASYANFASLENYADDYVEALLKTLLLVVSSARRMG